MKLKLKIWRQTSPEDRGAMVDYDLDNISPDMSFLEMIDVLNNKLVVQGDDPVAFDHDCREGICGMCSMVINGKPHGPSKAITTCQLHMRSFNDGDTIYIEPWRAKPFPVVKDLVVDRSAFDRIIQAGGYISVNTGNAVDANAVPIEKHVADTAFDSATCIGCGACVATCTNGSAALFTSAKIAHLAMVPQGEPERKRRAIKMVEQMQLEGFGACSNTGACTAVCPKEISQENIAMMKREYLRASISTIE